MLSTLQGGRYTLRGVPRMHERPIGDLVIIDSLMKLENLTTRPKPIEALGMADRWKPFRSYASLYLWKMKDSPSPK